VKKRSPGKIRSCEPICVECGDRGKMVSGAVAYPHKPERRGEIFFRCDCGAIVSCHPGTGIPAGRPASAATRGLRYEAHRLLDAMWGAGRRTPLAAGHARKRAYKWLARQLGIRPEDCHFGFMDATELRRAIDICRQAQGRAA
jgi:hypothetical protein